MDPEPNDNWPQRTVLSLRREYVEGFDRLLGLAQRELRIFDADLAELGLGETGRIELLRELLLKSRSSRVYVALQQTDYVKKSCPRLIALLGSFSSMLFIHQTQGDAARVQDCFVLCDCVHVVRRPVRAQPRGVLILNDFKEAQLMRERFDEIWESSVPSVSVNTAGL